MVFYLLDPSATLNTENMLQIIYSQHNCNFYNKAIWFTFDSHR